LVLPNTDRVSKRVVVMPTGAAMHTKDIRAITSILEVLSAGAA
jgi:dTDP-4-amino-4,6-dideoxygalactose transaminase